MNWNVFFMGVTFGTAAMCFFAGLPWWVTAINVFAFVVNAVAVYD